ncbi:hypothetical protein ABRP29_25375, partial [Pseudomonas sp. WHRI 8822A]|uniref:hypothetical protein n=1 Tax=Pseudomonas sp. WHRI 8822A TaxID=3162568 RepID=UPI0032EC8CE7
RVMSPTSYQTAPSRGANCIRDEACVNQFLLFNQLVKSKGQKNKKATRLSGLSEYLVAGAGFEPTTFGL